MNEEGVCQTTPNALEENTLNIVTQDLTHLNDDENQTRNIAQTEKAQTDIPA